MTPLINACAVNVIADPCMVGGVIDTVDQTIISNIFANSSVTE
jgi:hypothetical protein